MQDLSPLKMLEVIHSIIQELIHAVLHDVRVQNMSIPTKFLVFYAICRLFNPKQEID
jgi:hypothetical protein